MPAFIIVGVLIAVYVVFVFAPAILSHNLVFGRQKDLKELWENPKPKTYYTPYMDRMLADCEFFTKELKPHELNIKSHDGKNLFGRYYAHDESKKRATVLFFHGYRTSALEAFAMTARRFYDRGYDVVIVDERGHMRSSGRSAMGLLEKDDIWSWTNYIQAMGVDDIVIYGVSMGAAALAYASPVLNELNVRAMIIDSGFSCVREQLRVEHKRWHIPDALFMPLEKWLCEFTLGIHLDADAVVDIGRTTVPAFFIHEAGDPTVDVTHTNRLYEACASDKEVEFVDGDVHTFGFIDGGEALRERVFSFIERHMNQ